MIKIKFIAESLDKLNKLQTMSVYYEEIDELTIMLLESQRYKIQNEYPTHRVMMLIENMEDL